MIFFVLILALVGFASFLNHKERLKELENKVAELEEKINKL